MARSPTTGDSPRAPPGFWDRYAGFLERRAGTVVLVALALTSAGGWLASRLTLKSAFSELLPENAPSVKELDRIEARIGGLSTIYVAIEGGEWKQREKFVERVAAALRRQIPASRLAYIDYRITAAKEHFRHNRYLYIDLADLYSLRDRLRKKIADVRRRRLIVDLEDRPPYKFSIADIQQKYQAKVKDYDHFPDGYFITPDRTLQALLLRIRSPALAESGTARLLERIRSTVAALHPERSGYRLLLGGDPVTALQEREGVVKDLVTVSIACVLLVILSIVLYYRSFRFLFLIGAPVAVGVPLAFAVAYLTVGHLNSNTAFLGSIIVGNGINFAIILLARYLEERRQGASAAIALRVSLRQTWLATATASLAAAIAYGSLLVTDFRGFNQFGFIGGMGMILCWLATFTVAPALLILFERRWPVRTRPLPRWSLAAPDRIFRLLRRFHRPLALGGLVLTAASVVGAAFFYRDPFEYDFRKLRSRHASESGSSVVGARVDTIFAGTRFVAGSPIVVLADRPDQVPLIVKALERKRARSGLIGRIESIASVLPRQQKKKLAVLREIRGLLDKKVIGWMTPEQRREVLKYRPPAGLRPLTADMLPDILVRPFTERDGRRGLVVYAYPPPGTDYFQGKRLIAFANLIRKIRLSDGDVIRTSGRVVVLADILEAVLHDGPLATLVSLAGVLLLVALAFRRSRARFAVLASLLTGVVWLCGVAALLGIKINMLNFVVLPITFGIGVDYAVNVHRRYDHEGPGGLGHALWGTGGAVALCSLTTIIGFSSLLFADTRALNSFGLAALLGEITTLAAALLWMPALIRILDRKHFKELETARETAGPAQVEETDSASGG